MNGGTLAMTNGFTLAANRGVTIGAGGGTVDISSGSLAYNGIVTGGGGLTKNGAGTLALQNPGNNYSGATTLNAGVLSMDGDSTLGDQTGTLTLAGGTLSTTATRGASTSNPVGNPINLTADTLITTASVASTVDLSLTNDNFTGSAGTLTVRNDGADGAADVFVLRLYGTGFTFNRPISVANGTIGLASIRCYAASGVQTFNGVISGSGTIHRRSSTAAVAGDTVLNGDNTYSGGTSIADGGIGFGISSTGPANAPTSGPIGSGALAYIDSSSATSIRTIFASGGARTVGNTITIGGAQINQIKGSNNLTLSGDINLGAANRVFQVDNTGATILSGVLSNGGLVKTGPGTLTLNGANTYSGPTTVTNGTLAGTGTILGPVTVQTGGTLSPGSSIGMLSISNTLNLDAGSTTSVEINKTANTSDKVVGLTTVTYGGTLNVNNLSGTLAGGDSFTLFSAATHTGSFASIVPATPGAGLTWSFTNGVLSVVGSLAPPTLGVSQAGNILTFTWTGAFKLQAQTNSVNVGITGTWSDYPGGNVSGVTATVNPVNDTVFFRLINL